MTIVSYTDFTTTGYKPLQLTTLPTSWAKDISSYDKLIEVSRKISAMQTVLMEYIRETTNFLKSKGIQISGASPAASASAFTNSLESFKTACPSLAKSVQSLHIKATQQNLKAAKVKLADADAKLGQLQERTCILERKILTHEPETREEAICMIQFLSRLFKAHGKVEDEYLSHVLEACAHAAEISPTSVASKPYRQLAAA